MVNYGAAELARAFRTVRNNTITIAEELTPEQYGFQAAPSLRTAGAMLAHISVITRWQIEFHRSGVTTFDFALFGKYVAQAAADEQALTTKAQIVAALREDGERFAAFLEGLSTEALNEVISFPPPVQPATKTRFEMLLGTKEHEMHHRAQLMLVQRLLGTVPHLTRQREAFAASLQKA